jgi:hypothetical protein
VFAAVPVTKVGCKHASQARNALQCSTADEYQATPMLRLGKRMHL